MRRHSKHKARKQFEASRLESRQLLSSYGLNQISNFDSNNSGDKPIASVMDSAGNLFGITSYGGAYGYGDVFELAHGSGTITTIASFNLQNGAQAANIIVDSSGDLFGTTSIGGASNNGTVFEIAKDTGFISTLVSMDGTHGGSPKGICIDAQGNLFGTAMTGGAYNNGTFFEIPAGASSMQVIHTFVGPEGTQPNCVIADTDGTIYGSCASDTFQTARFGTLFKYGGGVFNPLINLAYAGPRYGANHPIALGLDSAHNLYGLTDGYGYGNQGAAGGIFRVEAHSVNIISWGDFFGANGSTPTSFTVDAAGNIYGTTSTGTSGSPSVFRELRSSDSDPVTVTTIPFTTGSSPVSLQVDPSGNLIGLLANGPIGGSVYGGVAFKVDLSSPSPALSTQALLGSIGGNRPSGARLTHDPAGNVYGITDFGGVGNYQSLYKIPAGTNTLVTLATVSSFDYSVVALVADNAGNLYGATAPRGSITSTVFELPAGSTTIQTLATINVSGEFASALTIDSIGNLYGTLDSFSTVTTAETIFELPKGQTTVTTIAIFDGSAGYHPQALVVDADRNLYGYDTVGGAANAGAVFELPMGTHSISAIGSFSDSLNVGTSITVGSDETVYGTIGYARYQSAGSVFKIPKNGTSITTIASFASGTGAPSAIQLDSSGNIFGVATYGGPDQAGSVFEIAAGTAVINTLFTFSTINAYNPVGLTLTAQGNLYASFLTSPGTWYGGVLELSPITGSDVIAGTAGVDPIVLRRDWDHSHIDWSTATSFGQLLADDPQGFTFNGDGSTDVITLDYSHGNPLPDTLHLNGQFVLTGLSGTNPMAGVSLEIGQSTVYVSYANPASDPLASVQRYLQAGYNDGAWTGTPRGSTGVILSSNAAADPAKTTGIGYVDSASGLIPGQPANTIELKYVLFGDTGLLGTSGAVGFTDFMRMTQHYTSTNATWQLGDFNYDGTVDGNDFALLQPNYGQTLTLAAVSPAPPAAPPMNPIVSAVPGAKKEAKRIEPESKQNRAPSKAAKKQKQVHNKHYASDLRP